MFVFVAVVFVCVFSPLCFVVVLWTLFENKMCACVFLIVSLFFAVVFVCVSFVSVVVVVWVFVEKIFVYVFVCFSFFCCCCLCVFSFAYFFVVWMSFLLKDKVFVYCVFYIICVVAVMFVCVFKFP